jgi:hypothetical protein
MFLFVLAAQPDLLLVNCLRDSSKLFLIYCKFLFLPYLLSTSLSSHIFRIVALKFLGIMPKLLFGEKNLGKIKKCFFWNFTVKDHMVYFSRKTHHPLQMRKFINWKKRHNWAGLSQSELSYISRIIHCNACRNYYIFWWAAMQNTKFVHFISS